MSGKAAKKQRQEARRAAAEALGGVAPAIETVALYSKGVEDRVADLEAWRRSGLKGRLRWLLTGR